MNQRADELGSFFVRGPTDAVKEPSQYFCRVCRKDVSVLTHGPYEPLRRFQGSRQFPSDQRMRQETPGWRVSDFQGKHFTEDELKQRRDKIRKSLSVVWDRDYPFTGDLIVDEAGVSDPNLTCWRKSHFLCRCCKQERNMRYSRKFGPSSFLLMGPSRWKLPGTAMKFCRVR